MTGSRSSRQFHLTNNLNPLRGFRPLDDPNPITSKIRNINDSIPLERLMRVRSLLAAFIGSGVWVGELEFKERRVRREEGRGECCECSCCDGWKSASLGVNCVVDCGSATVL